MSQSSKKSPKKSPAKKPATKPARSVASKSPSGSAKRAKKSTKAVAKKASRTQSGSRSSVPKKALAPKSRGVAGPARQPTQPLVLDEMPALLPSPKTRPALITKIASAYRATVRWLDQKD